MSAPDALRSWGDHMIGRLVHEEHSPHQHLLVVEGRDAKDPDQTRALYVNGARQGVTFTHRPTETPTEYVHAFHVARLLRPAARDALFIGGGAFSGPKGFLAAYPGMRVDVVELDGGVVRVAAAHFHAPVEDPRMRVFVEDGRAFLASADRAYDISIVDAFGGRDVPKHLLTAEFFAEARERLAPDGLLVLNLISPVPGPRRGVLRSAFRTLHEAFPAVAVLPVRGDGYDGSQNVLLFASPREEEWDPAALRHAARAASVPGVPRLDRYARRLLEEFDAAGAPIVRDAVEANPRATKTS